MACCQRTGNFKSLGCAGLVAKIWFGVIILVAVLISQLVYGLSLC
jgi:hypothetical protein